MASEPQKHMSQTQSVPEMVLLQGVSEDYFSDLVYALSDRLGEAAKPWPWKKLQVLVEGNTNT
jgi:hypothetical protein